MSQHKKYKLDDYWKFFNEPPPLLNRFQTTKEKNKNSSKSSPTSSASKIIERFISNTKATPSPTSYETIINSPNEDVTCDKKRRRMHHGIQKNNVNDKSTVASMR